MDSLFGRAAEGVFFGDCTYFNLASANLIPEARQLAKFVKPLLLNAKDKTI